MRDAAGKILGVEIGDAFHLKYMIQEGRWKTWIVSAAGQMTGLPWVGSKLAMVCGEAGDGHRGKLRESRETKLTYKELECRRDEERCCASFYVFIGHMCMFFNEMFILIFCPFCFPIKWDSHNIKLMVLCNHHFLLVPEYFSPKENAIQRNSYSLCLPPPTP